MSQKATSNGDTQQPPAGQVPYPPSNIPTTSTSAQQHPKPKSTNDHESTATNWDDYEGFIEPPIAPEIGGVYAPLMRLQYQRQVENSATVPLPPRAIGGLRDQVEYEQTRSCQCQKSNCLKLYCECFSGGGFCTAYCNCRDCNNYFDGNILSRRRFDRHDAIKTCLGKNPHSFRPGLKSGNRIPAKMAVEEAPPLVVTTAGRLYIKKSDTPCNCTKSRCLKKYCECFRRDEYCSHDCKCQQCMNLPDNPTREKAAAAARKKTAARSSIAQVAVVAKGFAAAGKIKPPQEVRSEARDTVTYLRTDTTYPPSYYAVSMTLPSGEPSATVGFGQGLTMKKQKANCSSRNETQSAFERAMATEEAILARRQAEGDANTDAKKTNSSNNSSTNSQQKRSSLQAQMEEHWNEETRDVLGTFQAMRQELLQRKQDAGLLGQDIVLTREYSYYDLVGSAQLAAVELELADVLRRVRNAEGNARELIARRAQEGKDSSVQEPLHVQKVSESPRAKVISEAAQDTAMMKELARIVRTRALDMSERL